MVEKLVNIVTLRIYLFTALQIQLLLPTSNSVVAHRSKTRAARSRALLTVFLDHLPASSEYQKKMRGKLIIDGRRLLF